MTPGSEAPPQPAAGPMPSAAASPVTSTPTVGKASASTGPVIIPDPQGGTYVIREPIKSIRTASGEVVQLRSLTPEEKAARRFRRNLIMMIFGLVVLLLVTAILMNVRW
jgi:hypothetical protein